MKCEIISKFENEKEENKEEENYMTNVEMDLCSGRKERRLMVNSLLQAYIRSPRCVVACINAC